MGYNYGDKCYAILQWADNEAPNFNIGFVSDMNHEIKVYGEHNLTINQCRAIDNIIDNCKIEVAQWL